MAAPSPEPGERFRQLKGGWPILVRTIGLLVPVLGCLYILRVHTYLGLALYAQQFGGLILGLLLILTFLLKPAGKASPRDSVPWYDVIAVIISAVLTFYLAVLYPTEAGALLSPSGG